MENHSEKISLLVAAWNEEENLEALLHSYTALDYPNKELILCAGGEDRTFIIAQRWADTDIIILEQDTGEGKFRALQKCLAQAHGGIVLLTDADCRLNSKSFRKLIEPLLADRFAASTGTLLPFSDQMANPFVYSQWVLQQYGLSKSMAVSANSSYFVGANSALRKSLVEDAYDTASPHLIGEDTYLAMRLQKAGHQIIRIPDSYVETLFPDTMVQYIRRHSRWRRDALIHTYQLSQKRSIWKGVFSVCKHILWLSVPSLVFFFGAVGVISWILAWGYTFWGYIHRFTIGKNVIGQNRDISIQLKNTGTLLEGLPLAGLLKLMFAESFAVLHLGVHMVIPALRYRW